MTPRNTSTGAVLEAMILPALARGGDAAVKQQTIGTRCGGGTHKVDAIATRGDDASSSRSNGSRPAAPRNRRSRSKSCVWPTP
jgi:hypothetical protein